MKSIRKGNQQRGWRFSIRCAAAVCLAATSGAALADASQAAAGAATMTSPGVQMYGLIGMYIDSSKLSTSHAATVQMGGGGMTTSFWGMRGREDIGGGNAVVFSLESFFRPNTGQMGRNATDGLFSRNAYVGLTGAFGTVKLGEQTNPTYINQQFVNPFGSSVVFSPLIVQSYTASYNNTQIGDTVWQNAVEYVSPSLGGLTGTVIYGVSSTAGASGARQYRRASDLCAGTADSRILCATRTVRGRRAVDGAGSVSDRRRLRRKIRQGLWRRADDQQ